MDFDNLGGRLFYDLILRKRPQPYVVHSDLTVMPGVTLYLEAGVELQFFPSVGILVLGTLRANGREDEPIYMRPFVKDNQRRWKRQALPSSQKGIRVCWEGVCGDQQQGFLELYNTSTQQWVPVCDPYFTEQNAQTVCREMGRDTINAIFLMDRRRDVDQNSLSHVVHWPEPRLCEGHEQRFEECVVRSSGFYGSTYPCSYDSRFVFVYCGEQNLPPGTSYWGGIRFSDSTFEPRSSYSDTNIVILKDSILNYVDIVGAGILHNRKHPAVFAVSKTPSLFTFVNVSFSASHGISLVAPTNSVNLNEIR